MHSQAAIRRRRSLRVGGQTLHRCALGLGRPTLCGHLRVSLNPAVEGSAKICIGFGWLPAAREPATGSTIVAEEGGPGYPSTGSAADFKSLFGHLLDHRNMLLVDARGTGRSMPIDCDPLQSQRITTASPRFHRAVSSCARQLNHTYRNADGKLRPRVQPVRHRLCGA